MKYVLFNNGHIGEYLNEFKNVVYFKSIIDGKKYENIHKTESHNIIIVDTNLNIITYKLQQLKKDVKFTYCIKSSKRQKIKN